MSLDVPRVDWSGDIASIDRAFEEEDFQLHEIACVNWPEQFPARPEVSFKIAHSGDEIYIKYYVHETEVRAAFGADNGRPWTDSCVEFFVSPGVEGDMTYYNLEMSCIGYGLLHGKDGDGKGIPHDVVGQVRRHASMAGEGAFGTRTGDFRWTLTVAIPVSVYSLTPVPPLSGRTIRGNFYKCGDDLPTPHFVSWSPIDTPRPSFHQPSFFGELRME